MTECIFVIIKAINYWRMRKLKQNRNEDKENGLRFIFLQKEDYRPYIKHAMQYDVTLILLVFLKDMHDFEIKHSIMLVL